ncbi:MAG: molybdopterin-dependent oxidoreductase [Bradyrhizobiaceae bacterium]|nr:molybdopterin-dependent oxidoreductase [Bradyrhizobiaceae bacterium]
MRKIPTFFWEHRGRDIPDPDLATYRLLVGGAVERRLALSLEELDRELCRIEIDRRFYCVNGWSLKALWGGYRVADLLGLAGSKSGAAYLRATSLGGYEDTTAIADVVADEAMLVTHMNGAPLPPARGKPIRLMRFDCYQFKGVKALARLEVVDTPRPGTWEKVGYSDATVQPYPHLAIDCDAELMPESHLLAGLGNPTAN